MNGQVEKLIETINDFFGCDSAYFGICTLDFANHLVDRNIAEVIHCVDCKYFHMPTDEFDYCHCVHGQWDNDNGWAREIHPKDFCSYAEKVVTNDA